MPWLWQRAHRDHLGLCCLLMSVSLALAACLSHGCLASGCSLDLGYVHLPCMWACHGFGSVPMVAALAMLTLAHMGCLGLCYIPVGASLAFILCFSRGGLTHGCYLKLGSVCAFVMAASS